MFSIFEAIMLICFGISWPAAIVKTIRVKTVKGLSILFCWFVLIGYISGIIHKIFFNFDLVIILYIINAINVGIEITLYYYYNRKK